MLGVEVHCGLREGVWMSGTVVRIVCAVAYISVYLRSFRGLFLLYFGLAAAVYTPVKAGAGTSQGAVCVLR
jgi:hypothetical protein